MTTPFGPLIRRELPRTFSTNHLLATGAEMEAASKLSGYFAAHAVLVAAGQDEPFVPFAGCELPDGQRLLITFTDDQLEDAVAHGRSWLNENLEQAIHAVLIFEGFITFEGRRTDAIITEALDYSRTGQILRSLTPYSRSGKRFSLEATTLAPSTGQSTDMAIIEAAYWRGVDCHMEAARI